MYERAWEQTEMVIGDVVDGPRKLLIGFGWDQGNNLDFELDAAAFMLAHMGQVRDNGGLVCYAQHQTDCGSMRHVPHEEVEKQYEHDQENILLDLDKVSQDITKIALTLTVDEEDRQKYSLKYIESAHVWVKDRESGVEIAKFEYSGSHLNNTGIIMGEMRRDGRSWLFRPSGKSNPGGLRTLCRRFGVNIG